MKLFRVMPNQVLGGIHSSIIGLPIASGMLQLLAARPHGVFIMSAELLEGKLLRESRATEKQALVLVYQPEGTRLKLFSNTVDEKIVNGGVTREPRPVEQAAGVEVLQSREDGMLLSMLPRASVRISYEGKRPQGVPPQAVMLWTGRFREDKPTSGLSWYPRMNKL